MKTKALRARVAGGMPAVRADLERLVRLASIAFDGFPSEPLEEAAWTVAGLLREAGLREAFGATPVHHGQGGSIPLVAALNAAVPHAEILLFGPEDPAARIHAADESVSLDELERCILAEALLLQGLAQGLAT